MEKFIGNLTIINYVGKKVFLIRVFFTSPPIEKYDLESIMGALNFLGQN